MASFDWTSVDLVIFDVDGTLYDQAPIRRRMLIELAVHSCKALGLRDLQVVRVYRNERERIGDEGVDNFEAELLRRVATRCGERVQRVAEVCEYWLQLRALPHLQSAVFPGVHHLFDRLKRAGKGVAVLSDYPAEQKLAAMGLSADIVVSAHDADVGVLKPNPRGLSKILSISKVQASRALMIGDRIDRDAAVADALKVRSLILRRRPLLGRASFSSYSGEIFSGL